MSETIQMVNPTQSQAEMRAETPEDDLLRALEESEGVLGKVNKPEPAVEQVLPEVIPAIEPAIKEATTSGPPTTYPEDIMPRGFEFKPSPNPLKAPDAPPNNTVAFVNPEAEPTVAVFTEGSPRSSQINTETNGTEMVADIAGLTLEEEGKAVIARKKAEEVELASTKIVHTNSGNFIGDDSETLGITSPPPDGEDGLRRDDSLAQGSRNINIEIDNKGGEKTMPPQQITPESVATEMPQTGLMPELTTPELEIKQTTPLPEVAQDNQIVSELAAQPPIPESQAPTLASEIQEHETVSEAQPQNVQTAELPVADLVIEPVMPTPKIEEIRSEVVSPEVQVEAPSPEPEANVIDFNQMKEATAKANEGLGADIEDTQKNFEGKLTGADVPGVGSANFRTMQKESDELGVELETHIDDTQEKFENLQNRLETQRQEILKNAKEVMAAASADIRRGQEERDRTEEALRTEEEEIARKRSENEEKFSRIVEKNNPILERSHELIGEYDSSANQSLEMTV